MTSTPTVSLLVLALVLPTAALAGEDAELRQQRQAAQKERQAQKTERANEIKSATQAFREYSRDLKADYNDRLRDLDTESELRRVELTADHKARVATAEADYQAKMSTMYLQMGGNPGEEIAQQLQEELAALTLARFELEKQAAEELHQEKVALAERKNELLAERDRLALEEADSLSLTGDYQPIRAEPIGGELTNQETTWNDRELKEVARLKQQNERLLSEFTTGEALREWELANLKEDFALTWEEKNERQAIEARRPALNVFAMAAAGGGTADHQDMMTKMAELEKEKRLVGIKYEKLRAEKNINRREERKKILDR